MNLKRCENEHFYDGDKFQSCPHCATDGNRGTQLTAPYTDMGNGYGGTMTEPVTMPMPGHHDPSLPNNDTGSLNGQNISLIQGTDSDNLSLQDAVNKAVSMKTVLEDDQKTVSFYSAKTGVDPVAGWLVCIEGADFGESFVIKSGRNFIGRAKHMDIMLHGDHSISREKHAIILYEPKRREFIAQAGESRELFYLNDEVVLNPVRLNQHDILTIGNTRLMFFPCFGEHFSWDDYKKDEEKK